MLMVRHLLLVSLFPRTICQKKKIKRC